MSQLGNEEHDRQDRGCNVSSTFNFTVGAVAVAVAAVLAWIAYRLWF